MSGPLSPCPGCRRHVVATETSCPFCAAEFGPEGLAIRIAPTVSGLSRAAALALGVTMAAGCKDGDPARQPNTPAPTPVAIYGAPAPPLTTSSAEIYGAPPPPTPPTPAPTTSQPPKPAPTTTAPQTTPTTPTPAPVYGMPPSKR